MKANVTPTTKNHVRHEQCAGRARRIIHLGVLNGGDIFTLRGNPYMVAFGYGQENGQVTVVDLRHGIIAEMSEVTEIIPRPNPFNSGDGAK